MTSFVVPAGGSVAGLLKGRPLTQLETRILLAHALGLSRVQLITQSERAFTPAEAQALTELFQRRLLGEPIAYIVGQREFHGLTLRVTPDVLIPRPETELLVDLAIERLPRHGRVLDMGTGSGAIAIAIAHSRTDAEAIALDVSAAALAIAKKNADSHGVNIRLLCSDWYAAVSEEHFDMIVANPPYIRANDTHLTQGDLRFEPATALTDHADGLSALRTIIGGALAHMTPGGWLLMEHGYDQAEAVRELLIARGFEQVQSWKDLAGIERVSGGAAPFDAGAGSAYVLT